MKGEFKLKKSNFVALMLGTVSGVCFALGMCMALLEEWNMLTTGIIIGVIGLVLGLFTVYIWRKLENKPAIKLSKKAVSITVIAVLGALLLGIGMSLCLVVENFLIGTAVGLVGILILICLIPLTKGLK